MKDDSRVSLELLLASNAQLTSTAIELNKLSQGELLTTLTSLFEGTVNPSVASLKNALVAAKEFEQKIITPFKDSLVTSLRLKKYFSSDTIHARLKSATNDFKTILARQLEELEKQPVVSGQKRSILIPGGLAKSQGMVAKVAPYLIQMASAALPDNPLLNRREFKKILDKIEGYLLAVSKPAYYEIEAQPNGKYTFRLYQREEAHSFDGGSGISKPLLMRTDVTQKALLSHELLQTMLETQLIGDLITEVPPYSPTLEGAKEFGMSLVNTLKEIMGFSQIFRDEARFTHDLLSSLGGHAVQEAHPFSQDQESAIASSSPEWDALATVIKHFGTAPKESQRLMLSVRLAFLHHFTQQNDPAQIGGDDKKLVILRAAKEQMALRALKMAQQGHLTPNDLELIRHITSQADQLAARAKEVERLRFHKAAALVTFSQKGHDRTFSAVKLPVQIPQNNFTFKLSDAHTYRPIDELVDWQPKESSWNVDLQNFSQLFFQQIDAGNLVAVVDSIELLIDKIDDMLPWINFLSPEEVEKTICHISEIARAYSTAHFVSHAPLYADPKAFVTILSLLEMGDDLRQQLPSEDGLKKATLYTNQLKVYLESENNHLIPFGLRLFDPKLDRRILRIKNKVLSAPTLKLPALGKEDDHFGAIDEMGLGLWRYRDSLSFSWPLGFEAQRVAHSTKINSDHIKDNAIVNPLFNQQLPYWKAFAEKFPEVAKSGSKLAQVAAAYQDPSDSTLGFL